MVKCFQIYKWIYFAISTFEIIEEMAWLLSLLYWAEDHPDLSLRVLWYIGDMFDIPSDFGDCFVRYQSFQARDKYFSKSFAPVHLYRPKCSTNCLLLCSYLSCSTCCLRFFSWFLNHVIFPKMIFLKRNNLFSLFQKYVFIFQMGFRMSFWFQNMVLFQNVLSFSERFGECCLTLSQKQNCKQNLFIHYK